MTVGDYRQMTDKVLESSRSSIISHGSSKAVFYPSPPPFVSASATDAVQSASDGDRNHVTSSADNNKDTTKVSDNAPDHVKFQFLIAVYCLIRNGFKR